eukprot:scaffold53212_cov54-Phaeocystis_antarctica.AAC.1
MAVRSAAHGEGGGSGGGGEGGEGGEGGGGGVGSGGLQPSFISTPPLQAQHAPPAPKPSTAQTAKVPSPGDHPVPYVYAGAPEHPFKLTYWLHNAPVLDRHGAVLLATDIKSWHSQGNGGEGGGGGGEGGGGGGDESPRQLQPEQSKPTLVR